MTSKTDLLFKIKALAENGVDGEQDNAKEKLAVLMKKYGVTEDDLDSISWHFWKYKKGDKLSKNLLYQIIYAVMGNVEVHKHERTFDYGCKCTKAEAIEIEAMFSFYYAEMQKDLEIFYSAFVMSNKIYPPAAKLGTDEIIENVNKEISDETRKAYEISLMLDKKEYYKQLE
jgi:hypothetical protein